MQEKHRGKKGHEDNPYSSGRCALVQTETGSQGNDVEVKINRVALLGRRDGKLHDRVPLPILDLRHGIYGGLVGQGHREEAGDGQQRR